MVPLFSIIIPIYKVEDYLHQCIESILIQEFKNFEIILVDDGSPDNCPIICDKFVAQDDRVQVIHKINGGLSDARNHGLKKASGDYIVFLDSDDYWEDNNILSKIAALTLDKDNDVILFKRSYLYCDNSIMRPNNLYSEGIYLGKESDFVFLDLIKKGDFECSACMRAIKRDLLINNNLYFKKGIKSEDIEWYLRVFPHLKTFETINKPFYIYRVQRLGSITNTVGISNIQDLLETIQERAVWIDNGNEKFSEIFIKCFKSYLAFQLSIVIGHYSNLSKSNQKELKSKIRSLTSLLRFQLYKQTYIVNLLYKIIGLEITSKILGYYMVQKHKLKI